MVERRTVLTVGFALLAVLALAAAAATLDSATATQNSGGFGAGAADDRTGVGDDTGAVELGGASGGTGGGLSLSLCLPFLTKWWVQTLLLLAVFAAFAGLYRSMGSAVLSGLTVASLSLPFAILYVVLTSCGSAPTRFGVPGAAGGNVSLGSGGGSAGMNAAGEAVSTPTALVGLLLLVAIVGSVALLFLSTTDSDDPDVADEEPGLPEPERAAAVGAAAGAAADRLEADADLENEVYRAWRELTAHLDVDGPDSSTPGEFAAAAVDAGMNPDDVSAITDLFEQVRYGDAEPTPERERRAVDALRSIEETYGAGDDAGVAGDDAETAAGDATDRPTDDADGVDE
ncbi:DUF4129 domain-containing protein [Halobaculum sp. D14]|uniref:DUF4129 domain-containing protein n=1 Tax=Halobaculum sp. D14 TaxID=3421642 RepID=UPI003EBD1E3C